MALYSGGALAHQTLQVTCIPLVLSQVVPADRKRGEAAGLAMAVGWTYAACAEWLEEEDARDFYRDSSHDTEARAEWRAGVRSGVATRMAERADDEAGT